MFAAAAHSTATTEADTTLTDATRTGQSPVVIRDLLFGALGVASIYMLRTLAWVSLVTRGFLKGACEALIEVVLQITNNVLT